MSSTLKRLDALQSTKEGRAALQTLGARGLGARERTRLEGVIDVAKGTRIAKPIAGDETELEAREADLFRTASGQGPDVRAPVRVGAEATGPRAGRSAR